MCGLIRSLAVSLSFVLLAAPVFAAEQTIKGELIDRSCYDKDKSSGEAHKDCAVECAQKGRLTAILTADGKVYPVLGDLSMHNNEKLVPHMSHIVEISGDVLPDQNGHPIMYGKTVKMPDSK